MRTRGFIPHSVPGQDRKASASSPRSSDASIASASIEFAQRERRTSPRTISWFPWRTITLPKMLMLLRRLRMAPSLRLALLKRKPVKNNGYVADRTWDSKACFPPYRDPVFRVSQPTRYRSSESYPIIWAGKREHPPMTQKSADRFARIEKKLASPVCATENCVSFGLQITYGMPFGLLRCWAACFSLDNSRDIGCTIGSFGLRLRGPTRSLSSAQPGQGRRMPPRACVQN